MIKLVVDTFYHNINRSYTTSIRIQDNLLKQLRDLNPRSDHVII
jgi:hypothetical protein